MTSVKQVFQAFFPDAAPHWQAAGIDVSGWQSPTVVSDLWAAGHRFDWVIVKASEGTAYRSAEAAQQVADCRALGLPWGVYHFLTFAGVDGEIANLLEAIESLPPLTSSPLMPVTVWLDCERGDFNTHVVPNGHDAYVAQLAQAVEARGHTVGIYTAAWWADGVLADGSRPLWVSDYSDGKVWPGYPDPALPAAWSSAIIWQFTSTSDEFGSLDLNVGPSSVPVPVPPAPPTPPLSRWLWLDDPWMTGDDVTDLQTRLAGRGVDPGPIDGVFGPLTDAAVRAFQTAVGIGIDGIVGPVTWGALTV
jgi:GH25 family lysozyme M1 (1,4-beta-N-acetylmuramidase)